jgi:type I restriction enzyme S subunit
MSEWKKLKLKEIAELRSEKFTPNKITSYPYIGLEHIEPKSLRINGIGVSNDVSSQKSIFYSDDILYGKLRPYFQKVYYSTFKGVCSTDIFVVKSKNVVHPKYLFYLLASDEFTALANQGSTGTRMPRADWKHLASTEWDIPDLPTQNAIAEILSSLDDKIELNNKINQELETLAQTLFKQWFIDFEFPNESGEPYKSSGGKMLDSELGEIPVGWEVVNLSDLFDFLEGPGLRNWQYRLEGMPFINIRLIQDGDIRKNNISYISKDEFENKYKHFALKEGDVVLSTSGTLGKSAIVRKNHLPMMLNTSVIRFRPFDSCYLSFMYQFLQSKIFIDEVKASATGSVQLNFGPVHLKKIKLIKSDIKLAKQFELVLSPIYQKIQHLRSENDELSNTRDTLLPKLISGELEINEIKN